MKFKSIRKKLTQRVSIILTLSFCAALSVIAYINIQNTEANIIKAEKEIRENLIAKGRILVSNNSQALKGMIDDYAFTAVSDLVSSTVKDSYIIYGVYMDTNAVPWVFARSNELKESETESSEIQAGMPSSKALTDPISQWVLTLKTTDHKIHTMGRIEVYEFAAPVIIEEEILGFIRYAITTEKMAALIQETKRLAQEALIHTLTILIALGLTTLFIGFLATHRMAIRITQPIDELTKAANTIANGDYANNVAVKSNDEIAILADNFDTMRTTIKKKMHSLSQLNAAGRSLASAVKHKAALNTALNTILEHFHLDHSSAYLMEQENLIPQCYHTYPSEDELESESEKPLVATLSNDLLSRTLKKREILFLSKRNELEPFNSSLKKAPIKTLLFIPLIDNELLLGALVFSSNEERSLEESDLEFCNSIVHSLLITIKKINMREVIEEQNRNLESKVKERTAELQEKTNDIVSMMSNMHQGLFTITEDNIVHHEYAAYLETIFETDDIAERDCIELLFNNSDVGIDTINQIEITTLSLIQEGQINYDLNAHLLIREYTLHSYSGDKILELEWDPIILDGVIDKIMVTVRDVTALRAIQDEANKQKKELEIIGQILAVDTDNFRRFLLGSVDFIEQCRTAISESTEKNPDIIALLFRNMHTIKGNARTYNFSYITDSAHIAEQHYDALRKDPNTQWDQDKMIEELDLVKQDIENYHSISKDKLGMCSDNDNKHDNKHDNEHDKLYDSPHNTESMEQSDPLPLLHAFETIDSDQITDLPAPIFEFLKSSYDALAHLQTIELKESLTDVTESLVSISNELGKEPPLIEIEAQGILIKKSVSDSLTNVFMHIFRNAIDHGIEPKEERINKGKSAQGKITLKATQVEDLLQIVIKDDGRGLALSKLLDKARTNGLYGPTDTPPQSEVADLIFKSALSTAEEVTDISGRGVGMDAARVFIEEMGGSLNVKLYNQEPDRGPTEYHHFEICLTLPSSLYFLTPIFFDNRSPSDSNLKAG